ncbi:MAG: hypothetical protein WCF85_04470 [Rhodospirillaceae bacterium]
MSIMETIADTTDIGRQLFDALEREAAALAAMKHHQPPTGFAEVKIKLITAYSHKMEELRDATIGPEAKEALSELKKLNEQVLTAARRNAAALEGALKANQLMLDIVVKSVESHRRPATVGYGRTGARPSARNSGTATSLMITRNL